jgi:glycosyltransferase involved in cell wall biosynthesis
MFKARSGVKRNLIIISLLDGNGPTGVEVHFNRLIQDAGAYGIDGCVISPYPAKMIWVKFANLFVRILSRINTERAEIVARWVSKKIIEKKLGIALSNRKKRNTPITLYAQDPLSASIALKAKKNYNCRVVVVVHFNVSEAYEIFLKGKAKVNGPLWRCFMLTERQALSQVDQIIFVSQFMQRIMLARLPNISHVPQTVIPNFLAHLNLYNNLPSIAADMISIGTLEPRKNQEFLLQVLAKTNSMGISYTLTIVGDGPDMVRLNELTKKLGLVNQVKFLGFQSNAARLIPKHRVLVHAATIENMPITIIEAISLGIPVLAPAVGGITEIFTHAVEGYYWPLDDIDNAADLLVKILSDTETYKLFSQAALARYKTKFDGNLLVGHWLKTILS